MLELTLPLMGNEVAYMVIPAPLSEENYDYLLQQLSLMKRGLVDKRAEEEPLPGNPMPSLITREMRLKLLDLGYSPADISEMTPHEAWIKIGHAEGRAFDAKLNGKED